MGENEQGGMLRVVTVVGLIAIIATVVIFAITGLKSHAEKTRVDTTAKVVKLQNYGHNLLINSGPTRTATGNNSENQNPSNLWYAFADNSTVGQIYTRVGRGGDLTVSFDWTGTGTGSFYPQFYAHPWGLGETIATPVTVNASNTSGHYEFSFKVPGFGSTSTAAGVKFRLDNFQGTLSISNMKFEEGSEATMWSED